MDEWMDSSDEQSSDEEGKEDDEEKQEKKKKIKKGSYRYIIVNIYSFVMMVFSCLGLFNVFIRCGSKKEKS